MMMISPVSPTGCVFRRSGAVTERMTALISLMKKIVVRKSMHHSPSSTDITLQCVYSVPTSKAGPTKSFFNLVNLFVFF